MLDGVRSVTPRRACCGGCGATHVLCPSWSVPRRRDGAEVIGEALRPAAGASSDRPPAWAIAGNRAWVAAGREGARRERARGLDAVAGCAGPGAGRGHARAKRAGRRGRSDHAWRESLGAAVRSRAAWRARPRDVAGRRAAVRTVAGPRPLRASGSHRSPSHARAQGTSREPQPPLHGERSPAKVKRSQRATRIRAAPRPGRLHRKPLTFRSTQPFRVTSFVPHPSMITQSGTVMLKSNGAQQPGRTPAFPPRTLNAAHEKANQDELLFELLPARRLRANPRVVKRKMSGYPVKRAEHRNAPKPTKYPNDAITVRAAQLNGIGASPCLPAAWGGGGRPATAPRSRGSRALTSSRKSGVSAPTTFSSWTRSSDPGSSRSARLRRGRRRCGSTGTSGSSAKPPGQGLATPSWRMGFGTALSPDLCICDTCPQDVQAFFDHWFGQIPTPLTGDVAPRGTGGSCRCARSRSRARWCSTTPAVPARSWKRWWPTTSVSVASSRARPCSLAAPTDPPVPASSTSGPAQPLSLSRPRRGRRRSNCQMMWRRRDKPAWRSCEHERRRWIGCWMVVSLTAVL